MSVLECVVVSYTKTKCMSLQITYTVCHLTLLMYFETFTITALVLPAFIQYIVKLNLIKIYEQAP